MRITILIEINMTILTVERMTISKIKSITTILRITVIKL